VDQTAAGLRNTSSTISLLISSYLTAHLASYDCMLQVFSFIFCRFSFVSFLLPSFPLHFLPCSLSFQTCWCPGRDSTGFRSQSGRPHRCHFETSHDLFLSSPYLLILASVFTVYNPRSPYKVVKYPTNKLSLFTRSRNIL